MKAGIQIRPTSPLLFPDLEFWFDGANADSFTLDGTYVNQWNDLSGNGRHVLNANDNTTRPTYDAATGRVTFTAANSTFLQSAAFASALAQPNTVFVVYKITGLTSENGAVFDGITSLTRAAIYQFGSKFNTYAGAVLAGSATDANDNNHVVEFNGVASDYWINGTLVASGSVGAHQLTGVTLGAAYDESIPIDAEIMEVIGFNRRLSSGERTGITLYLQKKWSI